MKLNCQNYLFRNILKFLIPIVVFVCALFGIEVRAANGCCIMYQTDCKILAKKPDSIRLKSYRGRKAFANPKPAYPPLAKVQEATVKVDVVIDEKGKVIWAKAVSGPRIFREPALDAACKSRFEPLSVSGSQKKASFTISYQFVRE